MKAHVEIGRPPHDLPAANGRIAGKQWRSTRQNATAATTDSPLSQDALTID
jgi:hypothetical protein